MPQLADSLLPVILIATGKGH